jgi:hypothetical protein
VPETAEVPLDFLAREELLAVFLPLDLLAVDFLEVFLAVVFLLDVAFLVVLLEVFLAPFLELDFLDTLFFLEDATLRLPPFEELLEEDLLLEADFLRRVAILISPVK